MYFTKMLVRCRNNRTTRIGIAQVRLYKVRRAAARAEVCCDRVAAVSVASWPSCNCRAAR